MTIESEEIIIEMLKNNGIYPGDPQVSSIYSYKTIERKQVFAVFTNEKWNDIIESPYVNNPILLWSKGVGLTKEGNKYVKTRA